MLKRFMSIARPVSGSHPPNSQRSIFTQLAGKLLAAFALSFCVASVASAQAGATISGSVTNDQAWAFPEPRF